MTASRIRLAVLAGVLVLATGFAAPAADFETLMREADVAREAGDFPAAEDRLRQALEMQPGDPAVYLRLGLVRGYQGRHDAALATLHEGLSRAPEDFDLRLAAARVKGWMNRTDEALAEVTALARDFPDNPAVLALKGRLQLYAGDPAAAEAAFTQALRIDPGNAEAEAGLADARRARAQIRRGLVAFGASHSSFSRRDQKDWNEAEADVAYDLDDATRLLGHARVSHRYGQTDTYLRGGAETELTPDLRVRGAAGATPDADFLARWTVDLGATWRVSAGGGLLGPTEVLADIGQSHYATGNIRKADPGLRQYLFDGRVWLTGRWLNSFDAAADKRTAGWSLRGDWQALDRLRLFAGYADAPEVDQGVTVETRTRYAGAVFGLTSDIDLTLAYTRDNRKNAYIREVVSLAIGYRF